ncbi:helix-turn-helix domain-containing protein [Flavobacterium sp.]|uniref:helix-turn-helix domain-containing protein n=1 Tax=Flavobacterium sp. TaxID=239 RepID=UPI0040488E84
MNFNHKALFPETENIELLNHQMVTKRDLLNFGNLLLQEITNSTTKKINTSEALPKPWLKSAEVREILRISPGTLQNLRINGTLKYKRIGGIIYYNYEDIVKMLEK